MYVIFFAPLIMSLVATFWVVTEDNGLITKAIFLVVAGTAAAMQFVPELRESVHFLVPMFMQIILCMWWYFASRMP
jgi:hypothetical protein